MTLGQFYWGTTAALAISQKTHADLQINGKFLATETGSMNEMLDYLEYEMDLTFPRPQQLRGRQRGGV